MIARYKCYLLENDSFYKNSDNCIVENLNTIVKPFKTRNNEKHYS